MRVEQTTRLSSSLHDYFDGSYMNLRQMQQALFKQDWNKPGSNDVRKLTRLLVNAPILSVFQCWVIGSILTRPHQAKDIDILLTRRDSRFLHISDVERALIYTRFVGLSVLGISVDPCFRNSYQDILAGKLSAKTETVTWKLEDHILSLGIQIGFIKRVRRVGAYSIVQKRCAHEANFFRKLPENERDKKDSRLLVAAVPIEALAR